MSLCRTTGNKHECRPKQLCLYLVYLFLRLEDGIDKLLVRDLAVEMPLGHFLVSRRLRIMVSIPGVTFIFASLDGRLDLSDNFDLPCSFSRFIQRYNVERAIPHRRAVFVTEPVSVYIPSHFWRIRIFRISSFMPRRYRLRFVYEKKNCSISIDTLHFNLQSLLMLGMAAKRERISVERLPPLTHISLSPLNYAKCPIT